MSDGIFTICKCTIPVMLSACERVCVWVHVFHYGKSWQDDRLYTCGEVLSMQNFVTTLRDGFTKHHQSVVESS